MKLFRGKRFTGGRASRAEVYALFFVAVLIVGGGIAGAYAYSGFTQSQVGDTPSFSPSPVGENGSATPSASGTATPKSDNDKTIESTADNSSKPKSSKNDEETAKTDKNNSQVQSNTNSCRYTNAELLYFNQQKADLQVQLDALVSQQQALISSPHLDDQRVTSLYWAQSQFQTLSDLANSIRDSDPVLYEAMRVGVLAFWQSQIDKYSDPNLEINAIIARTSPAINDLQNRMSLIPGC